MIKHLFKSIEKNFGILVLSGAVISYFLPEYFLWGKDFTDELIMLALFLGCLKIELSEVFHLKKNGWKMAGFVIINVILLPLIFYALSFNISYETRIAFFMLMAISGAVMTPLIAGFFGLQILWTTVFVVITSALIPFTLPFLIKILFGVSIKVSLLEMIVFLIKIIFIPAILAVGFKKFLPKFTKSFLNYSGGIGVLQSIVFIGIVIAINYDFLQKNLFLLSTVPILLSLLAAYAFRFLLGYCLPHSDKKERWTNSLMFGNTNVGLVILLAAEFFTPKVLFIALLAEIPWVIAQPVFQKLLQKFYK